MRSGGGECEWAMSVVWEVVCCVMLLLWCGSWLVKQRLSLSIVWAACLCVCIIMRGRGTLDVGAVERLEYVVVVDRD